MDMRSRIRPRSAITRTVVSNSARQAYKTKPAVASAGRCLTTMGQDGGENPVSLDEVQRIIKSRVPVALSRATIQGRTKSRPRNAHRPVGSGYR